MGREPHSRFDCLGRSDHSLARDLISGLRDYARFEGLQASVSPIAKLKTATQFSAVVLLFASPVPYWKLGPLFEAGTGLLWASAGLALLRRGLSFAGMAGIMEVTLKYFAWVRERIGIAEERVTLPTTVATVPNTIIWLKQRGEGYAVAFEREDIIRAAINQMHASQELACRGRAKSPSSPDHGRVI